MNNIQVTTVWTDHLLEVVGDENQLVQVILNILANAEHAMLASHGRGELFITGARTEERIKVTFTDDGPGITPENLHKVFDPFFTTKQLGEGTGLGLRSICYGIIQEHGGGLWAECKPGRGASINVELPVPVPASEPGA